MDKNTVSSCHRNSSRLATAILASVPAHALTVKDFEAKPTAEPVRIFCNDREVGVAEAAARPLDHALA